MKRKSLSSAERDTLRVAVAAIEQARARAALRAKKRLH